MLRILRVLLVQFAQEIMRDDRYQNAAMLDQTHTRTQRLGWCHRGRCPAAHTALANHQQFE